MDFCRFFRLDRNDLSADQKVRVPGLKTLLYRYQAFGAFVMLEMEVIQKGGWNADDMGLGKVSAPPRVVSVDAELVNRPSRCSRSSS